jgi:hypothetical protein
MARDAVVAASSSVAVRQSRLEVVLLLVVEDELGSALVLVDTMRNRTERRDAQGNDQHLRRSAQEPRWDAQHDAHPHRVSGGGEGVKNGRQLAFRNFRGHVRPARPNPPGALGSARVHPAPRTLDSSLNSRAAPGHSLRQTASRPTRTCAARQPHGRSRCSPLHRTGFSAPLQERRLIQRARTAQPTTPNAMFELSSLWGGHLNAWRR